MFTHQFNALLVDGFLCSDGNLDETKPMAHKLQYDEVILLGLEVRTVRSIVSILAEI